jgi:hypothetical protein
VSKKTRGVRRPQAVNQVKVCSAAASMWQNILLALQAWNWSACGNYARDRMQPFSMVSKRRMSTGHPFFCCFQWGKRNVSAVRLLSSDKGVFAEAAD